MHWERAEELLARMAGKRIVVVGDVMLDEYIWGQVKRISPEAPVMVVDAERYSQVPGGAANVVNNLCALGATGIVLGAVGNDEAGRHLTAALVAEGADVTGLITVPDRPTTRKTRIIAHAQQVVRVDHEKRVSLSNIDQDRLRHLLEELVPGADGVLLSDYQKGVLTPQLIRACVDVARRCRAPVTGNLKPASLSEDSALTVITLNLAEAGQAVGESTVETNAQVESAGRALLKKTNAQHVLITRGAQGLTLFSASDPHAPAHVPARPVEVYDVAGAGDTVISALTLALASGATALEAVTLANAAAAEAVKKVGVATVSRVEILQSLQAAASPGRAGRIDGKDNGVS